MLGAFLTGMSNLSVQNESVNEEFELSAEDRAFFENCEGIACADDIEFAIPRITMENNENFYNLAMAITTDEIQHYIATNEEVVYEAGKLKSIFDKIKEIIKNAWRKLQGVFDKVFQIISSWVTPDKKFVEMHKDTVTKFAGTIEIKGYEFANLDSKAPYANMMNAISKKYNDFKGKAGKDVDVESSKLRGAAVGKSGTEISSEDFSNALKEFFYGARDAKTIKFTSANAETLLKEVSEEKTWRNAAKAAHEACKKEFEKLQAEANAAEKAYSADMDAATPASGSHTQESKDAVSAAVAKYIKYTNQAIATSNIVVKAHVGAISKAHDQAKKVIREMVIEANKAKREEEKKDDKKAVNASASMLEGFSLI